MTEKKGRYDGSTGEEGAKNESAPEIASTGVDIGAQQVENLRRDKAGEGARDSDVETDRRKMPGEPT